MRHLVGLFVVVTVVLLSPLAVVRAQEATPTADDPAAMHAAYRRRSAIMCRHLLVWSLVLACLTTVGFPAGGFAAPEPTTIETSRQGFRGTFSASGAIADDGTFTVQSAHFSGSDASGVRIVHATEEYVGELGTFTIKRRITITPTDDPDVRTVTGTWTVVGGTGAYANLRAQGEIAGVIEGTGPSELFLFTYTGKAHYD